MEVTLQVLQTLPEENYQVLRFLTAFLVQVSLPLTGRKEGGAPAPAALVAGSRAWELGLWPCCSPLTSLHRFLLSVTKTR